MGPGLVLGLLGLGALALGARKKDPIVPGRWVISGVFKAEGDFDLKAVLEHIYEFEVTDLETSPRSDSIAFVAQVAGTEQPTTGLISVSDLPGGLRVVVNLVSVRPFRLSDDNE